mmetsp:Transcript_64158/g.128829  ORF Transcript_64158/g.128829 Transcript_64158/m.128829 type:complete len:142 (-) Transcript_64158:278-703(-)
MSGPSHGIDFTVARFVTVNLGTQKRPVEESVYIDPVNGPLLYVKDGSTTFYKWRPEKSGNMRYMNKSWRTQVKKEWWTDMTSTEKDYLLIMIAKRNLRNREEAEAGRAKMPDLAPYVEAAAEAQSAAELALTNGGEGIDRE